MKTRAAVLTRTGAPAPYATSRPLEITEVELAPPGPGEVLVRVAAAGLCHSDLSIINGDRPRRTPIVLGHEAAGVVQALGGQRIGEGLHHMVLPHHFGEIARTVLAGEHEVRHAQDSSALTLGVSVRLIQIDTTPCRTP